MPCMGGGTESGAGHSLLVQLPGALDCCQERSGAQGWPHHGAQLAAQQRALRGRDACWDARACTCTRCCQSLWMHCCQRYSLGQQ